MKNTKVGNVMILEVEIQTLNSANVKDFKNEMLTYLDSEEQVLLDLSQLTFVDSSGLGAFLFCLKRLNQKGGKFKLCNITKPVRVLFELVRLHKVIEVFESRDAALETF